MNFTESKLYSEEMIRLRFSLRLLLLFATMVCLLAWIVASTLSALDSRETLLAALAFLLFIAPVWVPFAILIAGMRED